MAITIEKYNTVRYGARYTVRGSEVVFRDGFWVLRVGNAPNGGGVSGDPAEKILPIGCRADVVVSASSDDRGPRFTAEAVICDQNGDPIAELREAIAVSYPDEKGAINSIVREGFPATVTRRMPGFMMTPPQPTWEEAVRKTAEENPTWAELPWWKAIAEVALAQ